MKFKGMAKPDYNCKDASNQLTIQSFNRRNCRFDIHLLAGSVAARSTVKSGPVSLCQQGDRMHDPQGQVLFSGAVDDLQKAAWISGRDGWRGGRFDMLHFAVEKFVRHFRLDQIVNPGAAAAPGAFRQVRPVSDSGIACRIARGCAVIFWP